MLTDHEDIIEVFNFVREGSFRGNHKRNSRQVFGDKSPCSIIHMEEIGETLRYGENSRGERHNRRNH